MTIAHLAAFLALISICQTPRAKDIAGRLNDRLVAEGSMTRIELKPSDDRDLPGVAEGDLVFRVDVPQFRPAGAPGGLSVALTESKGGGSLFVDADLDGRLTESERTAYTLAANRRSGELSLDITLATAGTPVLPFRCSVSKEEGNGRSRYYLWFTPSFRAEGSVDIGGRRTLISLPFDAARGTVEIRRGRIGLDANGDGTIDLRGLVGPEVVMARGDRVILRAGDRYVSVESADFAARSVVLREHGAEEYTYIEVRTGAPLPDFGFTDFEGRARRLSEFRGKYVLLDFWGSWCGPCVADIPTMKAAYERFHGRGFEILGIDYEHSASSEKVRALLKEKDVGWPNATPDSVKDLVEHRFRIWGFPTLILLDPEGVVLETNGGALRGQRLISTLERILDR